jgi:hypothetical protein
MSEAFLNDIISDERQRNRQLQAELGRLRASHDNLLAALQNMRSMAIPGMNWTDAEGQLVLRMADEAIANATQPAKDTQ